MKKYRIPLLLPLLLSGCASFQSGDVRIDRNGLRTMMADEEIRPFASLRFTWTNYPYFNPAELIGQGTVEGTPPPKPVPVEREEFFELRTRAFDIMKEAGLYDPAGGEGTLYLDLSTYGRWTYRDLFKSFLVETSWIMLLPSSLNVNYRILATSDRDAGLEVEEIARHRTVFHALIFPLYPFASPAARERALLRNMLWKTATDVYARLKDPSSPVARPEDPPAAEMQSGLPVPQGTEEIEHEPVTYPGPGSAEKLPGAPLQ